MSRWKTWFGLLVSVVAVVYAVRGVAWSDVWTSLEGANYWLLLLVFLLSPVINIGMRAIRWRILLAPYGAVPFGGCFSATAIGLMANNVLPARIGEFVRAYALHREERVPTGTALGALFVERMLDGFVIVGLLYAVTWVHPLPTWVSTTVRVAFYIFIGFLAFQVFLVARPGAVLAVARWISRVFFGGRFGESMERALVTFVDGFRLLRRPGPVALSVVLAFAQWIVVMVTYWLGLAAFDLAGSVGWAGALFVECVATLGVAVPSSPGFVGTFEAFIVKSLQVFGVGPSAALGYATSFHAASFLGATLIGFGYFFRAGLSWSDLGRSERRLERELDQEFETAIRPDLEKRDPALDERA